MVFALRGRGAVAALILAGWLLLGRANPALAGGPAFTPQDAARQAAFIKEMDAAANAARRGDRAGAQAGLRRALSAGGYAIFSLSNRGAMGCGTPAFEIPAWLLTAQAQLGDAAGAKETARRLNYVCATLEALNRIARTQAGQKPLADEPFIFPEAIPKKDLPYSLDDIAYRNHDYSVLKRLRVKPDPASAAATLREGLPYAAALYRANAAGWEKDRRRFGFLPSEGGYRILVGYQYDLGDAEGARRTLASLPTAARRATVLLSVAGDQCQKKNPRAAATTKMALALAPQIARESPRDRAGFYALLAQMRREAKDLAGSGDAFARCAEAVRRFPTRSERYDGLNFLTMLMDNSPQMPMAERLAPMTPQDRKARRKLLYEMRDLIAVMPEPVYNPPPVRDPRLAQPFDSFNPPRVMKMINLAQTLASDGDATGATETMARAETLARREPDATKRDQYLGFVETYREIMARQAAWRRVSEQ